MNTDITLILGVTAGGKATLAFEMAKATDAEIISIDSMKVYKRMDIGTAKPSMDRQAQVHYHLIDIVQPSESFSVGRYLELCEQAITDIRSRGKRIIIAGGTAMYIKTLLYGLFDGAGSDETIREELKKRFAEEGGELLHKELAAVDPQAAQRIHPNDERRIVRALEVFKLTGQPISIYQTQFEGQPDPRFTVIGLRREKEDASRRINARVKKMVEMGLVDEVRSLLAEPLELSKQAASAIGYAEIIDHINGKLSLDEAVEKVKVNTRRFAKGQRTWFKTFRTVNWIDVQPDDTVDSVLPEAMKIIDCG